MFANQRVERVACEPMRAAVLVLMVGIAALAWIAPASANAKAHTRVTLDFITLDPDDGGGPGPSKASGSKGSTYYVGRIFSKKKACKDHRQVVVYRARPGADQKRVAPTPIDERTRALVTSATSGRPTSACSCQSPTSTTPRCDRRRSARAIAPKTGLSRRRSSSSLRYLRGPIGVNRMSDADGRHPTQ
jgi:hypothetical protein